MAILTALPQIAHELDAYVDALLRLIADVSLRQAMGRACRERIAGKFSLPAATAGFLSGLARARDLAATQPRLAVSRGFAQELATLAVETTRLNRVADFLWAHWVQSGSGGIAPVPALPINPLVRLWTLLSSTRLGAALLRSRRLRALAWWLLAKLEARHRPPG